VINSPGGGKKNMGKEVKSGKTEKSKNTIAKKIAPRKTDFHIERQVDRQREKQERRGGARSEIQAIHKVFSEFGGDKNKKPGKHTPRRPRKRKKRK